MEHIVQFGITIDDTLIQKRIVENAEKQVIAQIKDDVAGELYGRDWTGKPNKDYLCGWVRKKVDDFLCEHKDEIIQNTAEILAQVLKRTKAVREIVGVVTQPEQPKEEDE